MSRFRNRAVLVTGAGVGIGYAICRGFAQQGAMVALNDMNESLAQDAARNLNNELGCECVFPYGFDVADVKAVRRVLADIVERFGRLDVVAANAGITNFGSFLEYTPEAFDRLTAVNLRGTYFTAQAGAQAMIGHNLPGRIILTSSVTGIQAFHNLSAYGVTKAGILMMAKTLAGELGVHGITVNAIVPGITKTDRTLADDPHLEENWPDVLFTRKVSDPEDVAAVALFLASDEAKQITGQAIVVDGGWVIHSPIPAGHPDIPPASSQLR
jgi:NAD(P)-dependent dehydrogenase (short-subunit alcohol dehydrogenase family)